MSAQSQEKISSPQEPAKKRRFSHESTNDLLFWGVQLLVVAISMALLYMKLENTAQILRTLLSEQDSELQVAKTQALKADAAVEDAQRRLDEAEAHRTAFWQHAQEQMDNLLSQVTQIQVDVKDALAKSTQTNDLVLAAANQSRSAASTAASEAARAAGTSGAAVNAALRAAANSSHTSSVVATKVVTTADKRTLQAQQRQLAAKQQKLNHTIQQVKKNGPNLIQQIFH